MLLQNLKLKQIVYTGIILVDQVSKLHVTRKLNQPLKNRHIKIRLQQIQEVRILDFQNPFHEMKNKTK